MDEKVKKALEHIQQLPNNVSGDGSVWVAQFKKVMKELMLLLDEALKTSSGTE